MSEKSVSITQKIYFLPTRSMVTRYLLVFVVTAVIYLHTQYYYYNNIIIAVYSSVDICNK